MSNGPQTTNPTATVVNSLIASAVTAAEKPVTLFVLADIATLTGTMAPVFAGAITLLAKTFVSPLVSYIGEKFSKELQTAGTFTVIDLQVSSEVSNVSKELAALIAAEKKGDPNAIKIAIQNYANANSALIHDDGSAPPK